MKIKLILLFIPLFYLNLSFSQQGIITGTVNDGELNDVLPFANVIIKGTTIGTTTDFDGKYILQVEPGAYVVSFSYLGYETKEVSEVLAVSNKETIIDITLNPLANALDEVVVTTTVSKNTEASVLQVQKAAVKLLDGLSLQSIKRAGASDIASAVKTVPGVSVQAGKYVYVRGLGDRYTKTLLNGMDVPGLDPDRNTLQLDVFPTSILDNIQVVKSFTPESAADFTGGYVDIITKDIPTKKEFGISMGAAYNSSMHLNNNALTSNTSATDFLGYDNGFRTLPVAREQNIPPPSAGSSVLTQVTQRFTPQMGVEQDQNFMNYNFGFSLGNQYTLGEETRLGFQGALSYRSTTDFFQDAQNNFWFKNRSSSSIFELEPDRLQSGDISVNNVLISALAGVALKTKKSKYRLNFLHIQNGESRNAFFDVSSLLFDDVRGVRDNIEYTERSITNALLGGTHTNSDASWTFEWKLSPTLSLIQDKDVRFTSFEVNDEGNLIIRPSSFGPPTRIWRDLEEINLASRIDLTRKHLLFGKDAKMSFGGAYTFKNRDFGIDQYFLTTTISPSTPINGDANNLLLPENIWTPGTAQGTYILGNFEPANSFESSSNLAAAYVSEEFQFTARLKSILGVRFEKFELFYSGQNNLGDLVLNEEKIIDATDLFPSANLIYDFNEEGDIKIRGSYSRTTARPSFKEASIAEIFDPLTNRIFIGNLDIEPTYIGNFDLRFEKYGNDGQFFALSGFYKDFNNPIELVAFEQAPDNFQPRNVESANVFGAEVEVRQGLGVLNKGLKDISFNANVSIIKSAVDMSDIEFNSRVLAVRDGETIEPTRELQGQSPYLINVGFNYKGSTNGWQSGLFYNVQGKTLEVVGIRAVPDVFTLPFHNLSLNISKEFGKNQNSKISLQFANILNDDIESVYRSFRATDQIYSLRAPGQAISLGYSINF